MAKTILNTSDKSNFILNMTEEQYSGLASKALAAMCFLIPLFTIPAELSDNIGYSIASAGLAISGVVCMILALIAAMKKYIGKNMLFPIIAFAAMLGWGFVSMADSYSAKISFYGTTGRGEGLLAIIFYFSFFVTALAIRHEKDLRTLLGGIIAAGVLNSVWGLLQIFIPAMPSVYRHPVKSYEDICAASGLAHSPIFLAMLLSLSLTAAVIGAIMSDSKKKRILCIICACLFSFVLVFTYSLTGMFGLAFGIIAAIAAVFISGASKTRLLTVFAVILPAALSVVLAAAGIVGNHSEYKLYDGQIMWHDSFNRLTMSGLFDEKKVDVESTLDTYAFLNDRTMTILKDNKLTGTGPEQLILAQIYCSGVIEENLGTFDKVYNEYLYTAVTRGIPSLIALAAVFIGVIAVSSKKMKNNKKNIVSVSFFFMLLSGVLVFFISCSNILYSPVFWASAGAACASFSSDEKKEKSK